MKSIRYVIDILCSLYFVSYQKENSIIQDFTEIFSINSLTTSATDLLLEVMILQY